MKAQCPSVFNKHTLKYFIDIVLDFNVLSSCADPSLKSMRNHSCFTYVFKQEINIFRTLTKSLICNKDVKSECSDVH